MNPGAKKAQSIIGTNNDGGRPEDDFYPTPPEGIKPFLNVEKFEGSIWECACGKGHMSKVLHRAGYDVVSTDKYLKGFGTEADFLYADQLLADNIVTNPPFKDLNNFIERAKALNPKKFAFFCKLAALAGQDRSEILMRTHLTRVWVFRNRIFLPRNGENKTTGSGMIEFAWFVWEKGYLGDPKVGWI